MARTTHDTMMDPPVENLLGRVDSKFRLVTLAARRARQINSYFDQLGDGMGAGPAAGDLGGPQAAVDRLRGDRRRQDRLRRAARGALAEAGAGRASRRSLATRRARRRSAERSQ